LRDDQHADAHALIAKLPEEGWRGACVPRWSGAYRQESLKGNAMIRLICMILVLFVPLPAVAQTAVPSSQGDIALSFAPVVKATAPAVVNIYATASSRNVAAPLLTTLSSTSSSRPSAPPNPASRIRSALA
jgi:S1-C subfamily serine protease